jgi:hypothetical protein
VFGCPEHEVLYGCRLRVTSSAQPLQALPPTEAQCLQPWKNFDFSVSLCSENALPGTENACAPNPTNTSNDCWEYSLFPLPACANEAFNNQDKGDVVLDFDGVSSGTSPGTSPVTLENLDIAPAKFDALDWRAAGFTCRANAGSNITATCASNKPRRVMDAVTADGKPLGRQA